MADPPRGQTGAVSPEGCAPGGCALPLLQGQMLFSVALTDLGYPTVSESLDRAFLPLPGHCLGMAFSNLYYNYGLQKLCKIKNLTQLECNKVCEYCKGRCALLWDTDRWVWAHPRGCTRTTTIPILEHFCHPKQKHPPFTLLCTAPGSHKIYFLSLWLCLVWTFCINGITQCVVLYMCLLPLGIMFSRFMCVVARVSAWFPFHG